MIQLPSLPHLHLHPKTLITHKPKMVMKVEEKRFALLMAARDSDYVKKIYGGYYNVFVAAFGGEGERWDLFRVVDGEFPATDEVGLYDGFVISGSPCDAYGNDPWVVKLCWFLQMLDAMRKKVLGICFGHQVLCRALGGKVGKAKSGWDIGVRELTIVKESPLHRLLLAGEAEAPPPSMASIIEVHQDEVLELPVGAEVVAFSGKTRVEVFMLEDHVLGIQGHPEYTKDILCNIIDRLLGNKTLKMEFGEERKARLERAELDGQFWKNFCKKFLKSKIDT